MSDINYQANARKDKLARTIILVVSILLAIVFAVLAIVLGLPDDDRPDVGLPSGGLTEHETIEVGSNYLSFAQRDYTYYKFTPSESAKYTFTSMECNEDFDALAILCDSSWVQLNSNDNVGSDKNFKIVRQLTSGKTYYLGIKVKVDPSISKKKLLVEVR